MNMKPNRFLIEIQRNPRSNSGSESDFRTTFVKRQLNLLDDSASRLVDLFGSLDKKFLLTKRIDRGGNKKNSETTIISC